MYKILLVLLLISFPVLADEIYEVRKPDGSISIHTYFNNPNKTLEDTLRDAGLAGLPIRQISLADLPADKTDRKYWKSNGSKITIDGVKKQQDIDAVNQKNAERDAVLSKLKISLQELEKIK